MSENEEEIDDHQAPDRACSAQALSRDRGHAAATKRRQTSTRTGRSRPAGATTNERHDDGEHEPSSTTEPPSSIVLCDEAEHRNDPGAALAPTLPAPALAPAVGPDQPMTGPATSPAAADEAEHRQDLSCAGGGAANDGVEPGRPPAARPPPRLRHAGGGDDDPCSPVSSSGKALDLPRPPPSEEEDEMKLILLSLAAAIAAAYATLAAAVAVALRPPRRSRATEVDDLDPGPPGSRSRPSVKFVVRNARRRWRLLWGQGGGQPRTRAASA